VSTENATWMQRFNLLLNGRHAVPSQRGLAMLDVLLGMAIFALIVVIGVQNFRTLRDRAYTTQLSSDVKQARNAIAGEMTKEGITPNSASIFTATPAASTTQANLSTLGVRLTTGNSVTAAPTVVGENYTLCIGRTGSGPSIRFTSASNSFVKFATANCT
jgi:type II secretory pathway pseudopilin PulG